MKPPTCLEADSDCRTHRQAAALHWTNSDVSKVPHSPFVAASSSAAPSGPTTTSQCYGGIIITFYSFRSTVLRVYSSVHRPLMTN
jgi:hypothetical protein